MSQILSCTGFADTGAGWRWPAENAPGYNFTAAVVVLSPRPDEVVELQGSGVHTRNDDHIELRFRLLEAGSGWLRFGFDAEQHEHARVEFDFGQGMISFWISDWRLEQPVASVQRPAPDANQSHSLLIEKTEGRGDLVKNANIAVYLDSERIIALDDMDLLPEMGVRVQASGAPVLVEEFVYRRAPTGIPEFLHLGGYQVLNVDSIEENFQAICSGLRRAAAAGVELLVTPEMSLTGLYPTRPRTREPGPVAAAEEKLQKFIRDLPDAPFLIACLPVWEAVPEQEHERTRYIASRLYDPDGQIVHTSRKVHSAEEEMWHGYRINEFDVRGVPISLHICHDHRYPELQTLPVMFGCRLLLHPSNGGKVSGSISGFEASAVEKTGPTHAFYMNVNASGGSYIVGPERGGRLIAVGAESTRDNPDFPMVGDPQGTFFHANIRVHDAFGYWPVRSFRSGESIARAYADLYRQLGGARV